MTFVKYVPDQQINDLVVLNIESDAYNCEPKEKSSHWTH